MSQAAIRNSVHGWINSVNSSATKPNVISIIKRIPLTVHDVMRVNHATIREGESHRVWPPSVVERFHAAEVIRDHKTVPYEIKDANLRRILA